MVGVSLLIKILRIKKMKKLVAILSMAFIAGLFSVLVVSCSGKEKCAKNCCLTEACKKQCVDSKCCEEGKTCDITGHKECKHKCCSPGKETCHTEGEQKPCCKTK